MDEGNGLYNVPRLYVAQIFSAVGIQCDGVFLITLLTRTYVYGVRFDYDRHDEQA